MQGEMQPDPKRISGPEDPFENPFAAPSKYDSDPISNPEEKDIISETEDIIPPAPEPPKTQTQGVGGGNGGGNDFNDTNNNIDQNLNPKDPTDYAKQPSNETDPKYSVENAPVEEVSKVDYLEVQDNQKIKEFSEGNIVEAPTTKNVEELTPDELFPGIPEVPNDDILILNNKEKIYEYTKEVSDKITPLKYDDPKFVSDYSDIEKKYSNVETSPLLTNSTLPKDVETFSKPVSAEKFLTEASEKAKKIIDPEERIKQLEYLVDHPEAPLPADIREWMESILNREPGNNLPVVPEIDPITELHKQALEEGINPDSAEYDDFMENKGEV